jgi:hypothetical protein
MSGLTPRLSQRGLPPEVYGPFKLYNDYRASGAARPSAWLSFGSLGHNRTLMKHFTIRTVAALVSQQMAMIVFMRLVYLDIFVSTGLAMLVGFAVYFLGGLIAARKSGL